MFILKKINIILYFSPSYYYTWFYPILQSYMISYTFSYPLLWRIVTHHISYTFFCHICKPRLDQPLWLPFILCKCMMFSSWSDKSIAQSKPNQSKAKGLVSPTKPILSTLLSLHSSRQFIQPELRQQLKTKSKPSWI